MPVAGVASGESPLNVLPFETALNVRVGSDVIRIVIIDEVVPQRGQIDCESYGGEE